MPPPTASARLFKLFIGGTLLLSGLGVTALLFIPWQRARETQAWTEIPCVITLSEEKQSHTGDLAHTTHKVFLRYRYTVGDTAYESTRWRRVTYAGEDDAGLSRKTPHAREATALLEKYPAGSKTTCWVNPAAPGEAVLEHQSPAAIYTLWWPMLFAVGGAGMIWSVLRRGPEPAPAPDQ